MIVVVTLWCVWFSTLSSKEHKERMQRAKNMSEAMKFFEEVKKRSQGNICEKHKAAAPYYFFLTSITDSNKTHSEPLSLQLFGNYCIKKVSNSNSDFMKSVVGNYFSFWTFVKSLR